MNAIENKTTLSDVLTSPVFAAVTGKRKGQFATVQTVKVLKVRKGRDPIAKRSTFTIRVGVTYDNQREVIEKRESGELPQENAGLPWGQWVEGFFPYLIENKGNFYIRVTPVYDNPNSKMETHYFRNGLEISREDAKLDCLASEFPNRDESERPNAMTISFDSIQAVK